MTRLRSIAAALALLCGCQIEGPPPAVGQPPPFVPDGGFYVSSVAPSAATAVGGSVVLIEGGGFETGATVLFGTLPALGQQVTGPRLIEATTPPSPSGTVDVTVRNTDGTTAAATGAFTFQP